MLWFLFSTKFKNLLYDLTKRSSRFVKLFWCFWATHYGKRCRQTQLQALADSGTHHRRFPDPQRILPSEAEGHNATINISICHSTCAPCLPLLCLSSLGLFHLLIAASPLCQRNRSACEWRYQQQSFYHIYSIGHLTVLPLWDEMNDYIERGVVSRESLGSRRCSWTNLVWLP